MRAQGRGRPPHVAKEAAVGSALAHRLVQVQPISGHLRYAMSSTRFCVASGMPFEADPYGLVPPPFANRSSSVADGQIYTWGTGHMGELGLAYLEKTDEPTKVVKVPPHTNWAQVACGKEHTLALTDGGILYAWGANELGQLGLGHTKPVDRPTRIHRPDVKYVPSRRYFLF